MGENVPSDSETLKLALPNVVDPSDNESGIGSCQSDEDLHLLSACAVSESATTIKPKRRVQFQTAENLVLIREIPPRGFYGSDVSDNDSGAEEEENDDDEGTDDDEDDKDDEGQQSSSDDQEESDSSSDSEDYDDDDTDEKPRALLIKTPVTTGSYSVGKVSGKSAEKISKITTMTLLPQSSNVVDNKTVTKNEKNSKNIPRKSRPKKSGNHSNFSHRVLVADGKKRKNSTKTSNLMKSTSSSRNKENHKKTIDHLQSASSPVSHKKQILNKQKSVTKISIDSPLQTSSRINSALYCSRNLNRRPSSSIKVYSSVRPNSATATFNYASSLSASRNKHSAQLPNIGVYSGGALKTHPIHKQYNAWQVANGNLDGRNLHTPSIAPMWENVHTLPAGKPKSKSLINQ